jgi:hypothetical protein
VVVLRNDGAGLGDGGIGVVGEAGVNFGGDAAGNDGENLFAEGDGQALKGEIGHGLIGCAFAKFLRASFSTLVDDGLVLRHLRGGGDERGVGGGVLGAKLFHRLDVAGVGDDHGVLAQLLEQILGMISSWGRRLRFAWDGAIRTSVPLFEMRK